MPDTYFMSYSNSIIKIGVNQQSPMDKKTEKKQAAQCVQSKKWPLPNQNLTEELLFLGAILSSLPCMT